MEGGSSVSLSRRLAELAEILAGHGAILQDLQVFKAEEPVRRRTWLVGVESSLQGQQVALQNMAHRMDSAEASVAELRQRLAEDGILMHRLSTSEGEFRNRLARCKDEVSDLWRLHEELSARHNVALAEFRQQQQTHWGEIVELRRWGTSRQRSRVERLEAELAMTPQSPGSILAGVGPQLPSPSAVSCGCLLGGSGAANITGRCSMNAGVGFEAAVAAGCAVGRPDATTFGAEPMELGPSQQTTLDALSARGWP
eukprot:CAMPEP_0115266668 /NCGR_PEP_ID=MMETSP0270-20121206/51586_1 /TAXON_ID=71861 /ORGANISM="Scrippsiella trochoidea, Strain CCMP3099" /LENGTH=254 /DNA_ID=CAMNT_0002682771 /DNA_START=24 /DNA_END=785 /DNA_ORIENTATION=+